MEDDILAVGPRAGARARGAWTSRRRWRCSSCPRSGRDALALAHEVRMRWCGPEVEVEGIVSLKTGGCPEDCHFCSQSGRFDTPVRAARLDIPALVEAARQTAATGATEFCIVAAVRGPDERLMAQVREAIAAITRRWRSTSRARSGSSTREQAEELAALGVHRYNHNLETARSYFPQVVTTHTWEERLDTLELVRELGMEVCCGGIIGMGETLAQRAEFAAQLAAIEPDEVPLNFLDPRPGHAVRRARRCSTRTTRCARSRRSASRCRAPCCASPAAASSRSGISGRGRACSAGSTR